MKVESVVKIVFFVVVLFLIEVNGQLDSSASVHRCVHGKNALCPVVATTFMTSFYQQQESYRKQEMEAQKNPVWAVIQPSQTVSQDVNL
jgi:uncharacterized membrane protein YkgB